MPIATIKTYKGALSSVQKKQLHKEFTDMMVRIEGNGNEDFRKLVLLTIEEEEPINMSMGGQIASRKFINHITNRI